jgi:hypothetical protein
VIPLWSSTSSPAIATEEEEDHRRELEKSHCTKALRWSRSRHPSRRRDEANDDRPSTGAAPQLVQLPDLRSPSTTTAAKGRRRQIRSTNNHNTDEQSRIQTKVGQQQHHLVKTLREHRTSDRISQTPPSALEKSTAGTKEGWRNIIP